PRTRITSRLVYFGTHSASVEECIAHPAGFAVSGPASARTPWLDQGEMGDNRQQSPGEILRNDTVRSEENGRRHQSLAPANPRGRRNTGRDIEKRKHVE